MEPVAFSRYWLNLSGISLNIRVDYSGNSPELSGGISRGNIQDARGVPPPSQPEGSEEGGGIRGRGGQRACQTPVPGVRGLVGLPDPMHSLFLKEVAITV